MNYVYKSETVEKEYIEIMKNNPDLLEGFRKLCAELPHAAEKILPIIKAYTEKNNSSETPEELNFHIISQLLDKATSYYSASVLDTNEKDSYAWILISQGIISKDLGDLKKALTAFQKAKELFAESLGINFFVVGATARDFLLDFLYGVKTQRMTLDIDFGVKIKDWESYVKIEEELLKTGYFKNSKERQRFFSFPNQT